MCPLCGGEIMEPALQDVLKNLQIIMKDAEPFMSEVEEWLATNYSLRKGSANDVKAKQRPLNEDGEEETFDEESIRKQTAAAKSAIDFQKRAGIKTNDMKSLVEKIQSGKGAADPSEFVGIDPDYGPIDMSNESGSAPLTERDAMQMVSALDHLPPANEDAEEVIKNYYEIEKLKKLQRGTPTGKGTFTRGG